jgi:HK97 family phage prohead protease
MNFGFPVVLKRVSNDDEGSFVGLASTWSRDRHGDTIQRGAFSDSVATLSAGTTIVPLLDNHRHDDQIGVIRDASETDDGLLVTGQIVKGTPASNRAHQLAQAGALSLSVGFLGREAEPVTGGGLKYKRVDLVEVSAVSAPSNRESRILSVRSLALASASDFERMLRDGELPPLPRRLAAKLTRACMQVLEIENDEPVHDPADLAAAIAAASRVKQLLSPRK